ncbi:hypothetical protein CHS0354_032254 [Potamilus streckersoni]|uniref:Uncharacterized protein n=1 Tax=Potamilus streckersoni TaxID=2493646 RepID=A0AAE0RPR4_9BIVA|nr:hypothetical protein CHS0354_032254 [Potamilus streckersoni]
MISEEQATFPSTYRKTHACSLLGPTIRPDIFQHIAGHTSSICVMLFMLKLLGITLLISPVLSLPLKETDTTLGTAVTVNEVYVEEPGHRLIRSPGMPAKKRFIFRLNGDEVVLDLQLNSLIKDDVNVYVAENGVTILMEIHNYDQDKEVSSGHRKKEKENKLKQNS